ncbi:hypothetical protein PMY38_18035 [Clostridium tertium]|jgi:hypothetical protein|uniref:hypothetical protein n=1 Tax=Clostridium tertium TaxID=1559 RepID=UPI000BE38D08|nr:hypothetical protein [Clostridium tertium]MDB1956427.1 hypothetical protein [Clostridium tertium]MDB1960496.1 hypothetical protein [Clostridium tertium]MDB1963776.1 hypothetical protein [Clostridium tertium]MDB1967381.1 hypothetical protein [Clostridium tertium]MDI9218677.1 hypothetical protein [Clostridium tertium]
MKKGNSFIKRICALSLGLMCLGSVTASSGTAYSNWYGTGSTSTSHNCNGWTFVHTVGVKRTAGATYTSGYSWVSYSQNVNVQTTVQVGHQFSYPKNGTGYAQTSTVTDLPGMPVGEVHL